MGNLKTDLIRRCIKGQRKAQFVFYNLYKTKMMGICLRYAKIQEDAEDIFQESFVKVFKNLSTLKDFATVDAWVKRIVIRTAINFYHRNKKSNFLTSAEDLSLENNDYLNIISDLTNKELLECINHLPDGYRVIFNLFVIDGYSHQEIAEMLDISVNTSKPQLRAAKIKLKVLLEPLGIRQYERAI